MQVLTRLRLAALRSNPNQSGNARPMVSLPAGWTPDSKAELRLCVEPRRFGQESNLGEAEARCRVALERIELEQGPISAETANLLCLLGEVLYRQRKYAEAEACAHRAALIIEPLAGQPDDPRSTLIFIASLVLLSVVLCGKGRHTAAEAPLKRAVRLGHSLLEPGDALMTA